MKVAHLTTHINSGGAPIYIFTLAQALCAYGAEQIVISSGGSMESDFVHAGIRSFGFDLKTKFEFHPKLFFALPAILRLLKKEKIELIHTHTRVGQILALAIQKITGIPFISTCHGFFEPRMGRKLVPAWGCKVIAISNAVKQNLIDVHGVAKEKIQLIANGIALERFVNASKEPDSKMCARQFWGLQESDFVVCLVSRMIFQKGIQDFLRAAQMLSANHPSFRALIVGEGQDRAELERQAFQLGLSQTVRFTGNLSDVSQALCASDVFIHPGLVLEGFGLSIAEAMATGLPVIATDQWALAETMLSRNVGEIVQKEKPEQIAAILESWIAQPEKIAEMGGNARMTAIELFDISRVAKEVSEIYREVLPRKIS